jgi:hypothetical protein
MFWGRASSHLWGVPSRGTRQSRLAPRLNCSGLRTVGNGLANSRISQPPIIANKEGSWLTIIANGLILLCEQLANNARDQPAWQIAPTDTPCPIKRLFHIVLDTHGQDLLYSSGEFRRLTRPRPGVTRCIAHRLTPGLSRCCKRWAATYGEASPPSTSGEGFSHLPLKTNSRRCFRCLGARSRSLSRAGRLVGSPL